MGTVVTIQVVESGHAAETALARAFGWFHAIEEICTRFDNRSELAQLMSRAGEPVPVSAILFEAVRFARLVAEETGGAFDPTVGRRMEARGFAGQPLSSGPGDDGASYRDIHLDPDRSTITLLRPLLLDLGAVAKGLAVDTAARELAPFTDFAIDAGGDLYLGGSNEHSEPWSIGIRHPRERQGLVALLRVSNQAVCTSGDYERRTSCGREHHILDPRTGASPHTLAGATVVASSAMLADALATAAFVLGPKDGLDMLERLGVEGLLVTPASERYETKGLPLAA